MTVEEFLNMCEIKEWYYIYIMEEDKKIFQCECIDEIANEILLRKVKSFSVNFTCADGLLNLFITVA